MTPPKLSAHSNKTFRTWFTMNYHNREEWNWALDLIIEEAGRMRITA